MLLTGPVFLNPLSPVLMKFREGAVAFTADIEAMFSRIRLRKEDAPYHQFLWPDETTGIIRTYQMDRLTFGDCCSPFIAIYVTRKTAEDHGQGRPDAVQAIHNNLYMDDYLDSAKTEEQAIKRALAVKDIL